MPEFYVLIILLGWNGNNAAATTTFASKQLCESAAAEIRKIGETANGPLVHALCFPNGGIR